MTPIPCPSCGHATTDGLLCADCTDTLRGHLIGRWQPGTHGTGFVDGISGLWPTLIETVTRQDRLTAGSEVHTHDAGSRIPVNLRASDLADTIRAQLVGWVRIGIEAGQDMPADTVPALCAHLVDHTDWWRRHEAVRDLCDEINRAHARILAAVDLPPDRARIPLDGPCPEILSDGTHCDGALVLLFPRSSPAVAHCEACGTDTPPPWERLRVRIEQRRAVLAHQQQLARQIIRGAA